IEFEKTYFTLENNKLKLSFIDTNSSISIDQIFKKIGSLKINKNISINFHNGKSLNYNDILNIIKNKNNQVKNSIKYEFYDRKLFSPQKNTTLVGGNGKDFLQGNRENNRLEGKDGDDVYYFSGSIGNDVIYDNNGNDKIYLDESFYGKDILFTKENLDLRLSFPQTNESILIKDFNKLTVRKRGFGIKRKSFFNKLETLQIGNDVSIDINQLVNNMSLFAVNVNNDVIYLSDNLERLNKSINRIYL
ncbi:hypothetical protein, partial [Rodentibacter rarus]